MNVIQRIASNLESKDLLRLCFVYRELRHDQSFWRRMIKKRYQRTIKDEEGDLFILFLELNEFAQGQITLTVNFIFDGVMDIRQSYLELYSLLCKSMVEFDVEHGLDVLSGRYVRKDKSQSNLYFLTYYLYPKAHMTRVEALSGVMFLLHTVKLPKGFTGARLLGV
ncbi:F-box domain [Cedratvirus A11]|uniref:F-box domain n=1 Tax=Cedratvirus A11 TaxID=1903266 RepID=A0A1M7XUG8_9VIRU|nr:F-box domain [Cedratvirus A11]SHO33346.1 F-box domain [Cedratvirus A11]